VLRPLVFALQIGVLQSSVVTPADSARLRAHVDSAVAGFFAQWTRAWMRTESEHGFPSTGEYAGKDDNLRLSSAHCHWDAASDWVRRRLIKGSTTAHATCPKFVPPDDSLDGDERNAIDNGLSSAYRPAITAARTHLRAVLDSAARALPHDIFLTRQRVRFALDAGKFEDAVSAALSCGYAPASCGLLQGLILYRLGDAARADSTFGAALDLMTPEDRCDWSDVRMLLEPESRSKYEHMTCAERARFNAQLWWLSDPLWSEPGNERRAEHIARKATVQLIAPLGTDGRQYFAARQGGESVMESLVRYGWPSQFFWAGPATDSSHDSWLRAHGAAKAPPYSVREYTRERRLHTVPLPSTLDDPFGAARDGWQLTGHGDDDWWPTEHYARDRSALVAFPIGQTVMLQRRDSTRFIWAGQLDSATRGPTSDAGRPVILFDSRSVGDVRRVGTFSVRDGVRAIVDASLAGGRTLLGLEVPGDSAHAAARARYAITVLAPLTELRGGRAVSQALLFDPPADAGRAVSADAAIDRMYTSTTLTNATRIGVYWESYGFHSADTVDLTVRIVRKDRPSAVVRAIRVLGIARAGDDSIGVHWREIPQNSRAIQRMEGAVPMQMRSIVLDLSRLPHGEYVLQLGVNRPNEPPVSSERTFELR
jgi:hypothetical protein